MDRRKSLKLIAAGAIATPAVISACKSGDKKESAPATPENPYTLDRNPDEIKNEKELLAKEKFFTDHEMATITVLADIIIPKDEISSSASEAKVPEFIEFIVKDMPQHQVPMRGGLRWLDMQCLNRYQQSFRDCTPEKQIEMVDQIAYPEKGKDHPELKPGISFFSLMRNLTATGFYTSEAGVKDLGYAGNKPGQWNGVPEEILNQYKVAYTDKDLKDCISFTP